MGGEDCGQKEWREHSADQAVRTQSGALGAGVELARGERGQMRSGRKRVPGQVTQGSEATARTLGGLLSKPRALNRGLTLLEAEQEGKDRG